MVEAPHISDAVYWSRLKNGDADALGYLYDRYADSLFLAAMRMTDNRDLAKDALQEVFIECWHYRATLGAIVYSEAYLAKVLRNILVKKLKRLQNTRQIKLAELLPCPEDNREEMMISLDIDKEQRGKLQKALSFLTSRQILILKLHFYEGLTYEQIADRLSMNYQSVNNLAFRTILRLRSHMFTILVLACSLPL
jgi:RNA polymerase sigma-70 factor (ECF subfamily)